eukprot:1136985-Pelagomonas_calceolata.AAC.2
MLHEHTYMLASSRARAKPFVSFKELAHRLWGVCSIILMWASRTDLDALASLLVLTTFWIQPAANKIGGNFPHQNCGARRSSACKIGKNLQAPQFHIASFVTTPKPILLLLVNDDPEQ